MNRAVLPHLDQRDTFLFGLSIKPLIVLVTLWTIDTAIPFLLWVATHNLLVTAGLVSILLGVAGVEFLAFKFPRDGIELTEWLVRGLHFYERPRRWTTDPADVRDTQVGLLDFPKGNVRTLELTGLDLALRSEPEQFATAEQWRRLVDARDTPVTFVAAAERVDVDGLRTAALTAGDLDPRLAALSVAYAGQLGRHHGTMQRKVRAVVSAESERALDAEETDLIRDLSGIGLRAQRVPTSLPDLTVQEAPTHLRLGPGLPITDGPTWMRAMLVSEWPREISPTWAQALLTHNGLADVVLRIEPVARDQAAKDLEKLTIAYESSLVVPTKGQTYGLTVALTDAVNAAMEVVKGATRLHSIGLYVIAYGDSLETMEAEAEAVARRARKLLLRLEPTTFRQRAGLMTVLPTGADQVEHHRRVTSDALGSIIPFATASFGGHPQTGILVGSVVATGAPVILDRFALPNHNMLVLGTSGGGKSFLAKLLAAREQLRGVRIVILDPEEEYSALTTALGGIVIHPRGTADVPTLPGPLECLSLSRAGDDVPADRADEEIARVAGEVLAAVWERIRTGDHHRTVVVVDEAFLSLVRNDKASWAAWQLVKRSRKRNASLVVVSQDVDDVLSTELGAAIINNSAIKILLRQDPNAEDRVRKAFGLSGGEWQMLVSAPIGEALLIAGDERAAVRIEASPYEATYCGRPATEPHPAASLT